MSDYLGNIIARTLEPVTSVRPQLPSIFEPSPASLSEKTSSQLEQENFTEPPPAPQRPEKSAPTPPSIPAPGQSVSREPGQIIPNISRAKIIFNASEEPESARQNIVPSSALKPREDKSSLARADAELKVEPVHSEPGKSELSKNGLKNSNWESSFQAEEQRDHFKTELRTVTEPPQKTFQTSSKSQAVQPVVPAIRPVPSVPPPSPSPAPTINVTIGRLEIRAISQPQPGRQRSQSKASGVLNLEDYLRQRANGGGR